MKKRLMVVMGLALGALTIGAAAVVLGTTPAVFTRATGETRTIVVNAADFGAGSSGNFNKGGMEFHYEGASKDGDTVTLTKGRIYMTMAHYSGESVSAGGLRGNGFTAMAITDLNVVTGDGHIVYAKPGDGDGVTGTYSVAANIDLTHQNGGAEVTSANRVRIHFEGGNATISFTKITYTYECVEATPSVTISGDAYVDKNSSITLTATPDYVDGSATYQWSSSDTNKATVVGNGLTATVNGVAAGNVNITVEAVVNEAVVASDTFAVTVTDPAAAVYLGWDKTNKDKNHGPIYIDGAGAIFAIDVTTIGRTIDQVNADMEHVTVESDKTVNGKVNIQQPGWADAPGLYVTFADANFTTMSYLRIRMPNNESVATVAELTFSWVGSTYTIETINGQTFAAYMA